MIKEVQLINKKEWLLLLDRFDTKDIYYHPGYVSGFQSHGDGEPTLIYFKNDNMEAINVVMKRDLFNIDYFSNVLEPNSWFDLSTPYGYGGFIFMGETSEENLLELKREYEEFCIRENIVSEFVRFHPVLDNSKENSLVYDVFPVGNTVTIELESKEKIWDNLSSKNRNVIRKAKKSNVKVYWGRDKEIIDIFIEMYNKTMARDNASTYYYFDREFYLSLFEDLKYNSTFFYSKYNGEIISIAIILHYDNKLSYHLSASNREYQRLSATNLLLYEVACWGESNGFQKLHLGGGLGSQKDNLYKFKKSFNKNQDTEFVIGQKILNRDMYDFLVETKKKKSLESEKNFFPEYR